MADLIFIEIKALVEELSVGGVAKEGNTELGKHLYREQLDKHISNIGDMSGCVWDLPQTCREPDGSRGYCRP